MLVCSHNLGCRQERIPGCALWQPQLPGKQPGLHSGGLLHRSRFIAANHVIQRAIEEITDLIV